MATKRIFAALDISAAARSQVALYIETLRSEFRLLPVRWERAEKLHITLKFAGDLSEAALAAFEKDVAAVARQNRPLVVEIAGCGAFIKRRSRANVLWLGLESQGRLERLAADLDSDNSRFKPHLTIARLKDANLCRESIDRHLAGEFGPISFLASEIVVYESTLLPSGSVYSVISKHAFNASLGS